VEECLAEVGSRSYFAIDSQSVCLGIEYPCGTCDQILLPVGMLLSEIFCLVSIGRPLWREDGSAVCSVITQWSESLRTRNHILLSHLRLPQPGGPGSRIYIPPGTGRPSYTPEHWVCLAKNRVAHLYPQALGSFFVASYYSQGCGLLWLLRFVANNCELWISSRWQGTRRDPTASVGRRDKIYFKLGRGGKNSYRIFSNFFGRLWRRWIMSSIELGAQN
jgi:hypothetical protein